jgi:glycosyltransferase involved in cell wall biosynthesis
MWEQIKYLGSRHDLTVVTFVNTPREQEQRELLTAYCEHVITVRHPQRPPANTELQELLRMPSVFHWFNVTEMYETLKAMEANKRFQLAIIEHIFMAQYLPLCPAHTILQEHNIESNIFRRLAGINGMDNTGNRLPFAKKVTVLKAMWMLMTRYENETWPNFPVRITVSDEDKREMDRRCKVGKSVVIDNGVDTKTITPLPIADTNRILFMGTMNYEPNIDAVLYFFHRILPAIWNTDPTIRLIIAGRDPVPAVTELASDSRVEVVANPPDMSEIAKTCCLTVVPLRSGSGTRIKILHAMAMGLPVISTTVGCEGLVVTDGKNILIRDTPEEFAEATLRLLRHAELRIELSKSGRDLVENQYDWSRQFENLENVMQDFLNRNARSEENA